MCVIAHDGLRPPSVGDDTAGVTTLMLRHIPTSFSQDQLMCELAQKVSPGDEFDFLYLPWDSTRSGNCGFAFVNFPSESAAIAGAQRFQDMTFSGMSGKPCDARPARLQGVTANLNALVRRVAKGCVKHSPNVMYKGQKIDLAKLLTDVNWNEKLCVETAVLRDSEMLQQELETMRLGGCKPREIVVPDANQQARSAFMRRFGDWSF